MVMREKGSDLVQLKQRVATANRLLGQLGLADWLGHASARIPGTDKVLIKGWGGKLGGLRYTRPPHIITVDLNARPIKSGSKLPPPTETQLHTCIYRARPDVMGIVHVHPPYATLFSTTSKPLLPLTITGIAWVARGIPTFPSSLQIETEELGQAVARSLGNKAACLLKGHGIVTVGRDVEEATVFAYKLEQVAQTNLYAYLLGKPQPLPPDEVQTYNRLDGYRKDWTYFQQLYG